MSTHTPFWRELTGVWAQWLGIGLAAVPAGLILGLLEKQGMDQKAAMALSLAVGFIFALILWVLIGRRFAVVTIEYSMTASPVVMKFENEQGAFVPTAAFAAAVLVVSVYCVQQHPSPSTMPTVSIASYAPAALPAEVHAV